jgi:hypothetical protein
MRNRKKIEAMVRKGHAAIIDNAITAPNSDETNFAILFIAYHTNAKKLTLDWTMPQEKRKRLVNQTNRIADEMDRLARRYRDTIRI